MKDSAEPGPLFNGTPPAIVGDSCEAFICEAYWHAGRMVSSANVTFIKVDGNWHRLSIDFPVIFWRECKDEPRPWAVESESFEYPHQDVGAIANVIGKTLTSCDAILQSGSVSVVFGFADGHQIRIAGRQDSTSFFIV